MTEAMTAVSDSASASIEWPVAWLSVGVSGALFNWYAVWQSPHNKHIPSVYIAKPLALIGLIGAVRALWADGHTDVHASWWFVCGLCWSLAGDVALMLPNPHLFLVGVGTFLVGHVCYIAGLHPSAPWTSAGVAQVVAPTVWPYGVAIAVFGVLFTQRIASGLRAMGKRALIPPIAVYAAVLALMWYSSVTTLQRHHSATDDAVAGAVVAGGWSPTRSALAIAGATLFFVSDAQLAWSKFVAPLWYGQLRVMSTYHVAQYLLAASLLVRV